MTGAGKRRLLLFLAPADHPHRDLVCATLAWVAAAEGSLFECYYDARPSGTHFGGGLPPDSDPNEMRGGTITGAHHLEQLLLLLQRFDCEAASLGPAVLGDVIDSAGVQFRSRSPDVAVFYDEVLASSAAHGPGTLLLVGEGRTPGTRLSAFAFPEIVNRRLLAIGDGDPEALAGLRRNLGFESLWLAGPPPSGATDLRPEQTASAAEETAWMAERWSGRGRGFILGDEELVGRWIPTAAREGWMPIHGTPQTEVIDRLAEPLRRTDVVLGRQHHDNDFLALSRLGVAFQVVDPGRPPFPVLREEPPPWPAPPLPDEPDDAQLSRWAAEGKVLSTLLFWTGMARELENLYALADVLNLTGMAAGLILTTESFAHMPYPPLTLTQHPLSAGGLAPRVELLLGCAGAGVLIESETPIDRFALTLKRSVDDLAARLGGRDRVPRGWWPLMDAPLVPRPSHRLAGHPEPPYFRIRYRPREPEPSADGEGGGRARRSPRAVVGAVPSAQALRSRPPLHRLQAGPPGPSRPRGGAGRRVRVRLHGVSLRRASPRRGGRPGDGGPHLHRRPLGWVVPFHHRQRRLRPGAGRSAGWCARAAPAGSPAPSTPASGRSRGRSGNVAATSSPCVAGWPAADRPGAL